MINNCLLSFFVFIFGLICGSFLNSVVWRLYTGKSFLVGRSICPKCGHKLAWYDLIPVFSFILLKGKCRYCHQKISWQYPLVEIATGLVFLLIFNNQLSMINNQLLLIINLIYYFIIASFLIILFVYDLKHFILPDRIIYPAIILVLLYYLFRVLYLGHWNLFIPPLLSALGAAAFFLLLYLVSQGKWIGFGDVKLGFLLGLILSWPQILTALFLAYVIGGIIGVGLILARKKQMKSEVPFGPFLITGAFIAQFFGVPILNFYFHLLG